MHIVQTMKTAKTHNMPKLLKSLYAQVIIAILIGILIGFFYPDFATKL